MNSLNTTNHEENKQAWKSESVLKLANHFHKFCGNAMQQKRVYQFEMSPDFLKIFTDIQSVGVMRICMAINQDEVDESFKFYPIIELEWPPAEGKIYLPLEPKERYDSQFQSEIVPWMFKNMVHDNWNKLDITYIDDLFIAQELDSFNNPTDQMVRVHLFDIDDTMCKFISRLNFEIPANGIVDAHPNITSITLYPGVDMNKFGKKEYISFTPVLGFTHHNDSPDVIARNGIIETAGKETFMEYMFPCPPTCVRKPK